MILAPLFFVLKWTRIAAVTKRKCNNDLVFNIKYDKNEMVFVNPFKNSDPL